MTKERRRRAGSGSVFQRKGDGRWVAQLTSGPRGQQTARRKVAPTQRAARELLQQMIEEEGRGADPAMLAGDYLKTWLVTASRSVRPNTMIGYEIAVRRQLIPAIGNVPLRELTPFHVEKMVRDLSRQLSPKTTANVLAVLSRALTIAERQGLVSRNVARLVDPPRVIRHEISALALADVDAIRKAIAGDRLEALYLLALATGLRQGELLGLRWADWDKETQTIRVSYSLQRIDGEYRLVEPKTMRSRRTVVLPEFATAALVKHRSAQLLERLAAGTETEDGLVFVSPEGRPLNRSWVSHEFARIADRAGVDVTFHGLRHGQASLLVALGVHPRVIQERLGHSTVTMTMDRYAHVARESDREAAQLLDKALAS